MRKLPLLDNVTMVVAFVVVVDTIVVEPDVVVEVETVVDEIVVGETTVVLDVVSCPKNRARKPPKKCITKIFEA